MADNYNDEITVRAGGHVVVLNAGYEHCEGGLYLAMQVARNAITGEFLVICRKKDTPEVLAVPLTTGDAQGWADDVKWPDGATKARFTQTTWFHFMHGGK